MPQLGRLTVLGPCKILSKAPVQKGSNPYLEPFEAFQRVLELLTGPDAKSAVAKTPNAKCPSCCLQKWSKEEPVF